MVRWEEEGRGHAFRKPNRKVLEESDRKLRQRILLHEDRKVMGVEETPNRKWEQSGIKGGCKLACARHWVYCYIHTSDVKKKMMQVTLSYSIKLMTPQYSAASSGEPVSRNNPCVRMGAKWSRSDRARPPPAGNTALFKGEIRAPPGKPTKQRRGNGTNTVG